MGTLKICSENPEYFTSREEAAKRLSEELAGCAGSNAVVIGIPRGGIVLAWKMAGALEGDMDFILAHKLRSPWNPEVAFGAVEEKGKVFLHDQIVFESIEPPQYIEEERKYQMKLIEKRLSVYRKFLKKMPRLPDAR